MARTPLVQRKAPEPKPQPVAEQVPEFCGGYVDGDKLRLLHRLPDGTLRMRQHTAHYASYHRADQVGPPVLRMLQHSDLVSRVHTTEPGWVRVEWRSWELRKRGVDLMRQHHGIDHYEADVSPLHRHFADTQDGTCAAPRVVFLDIETDSRVSFANKEQMRLLCWTVVSNAEFKADGCNVIGGSTWSGLLEADTDEAEAELLGQLWEVLEQFDVVAAWYGDGFDFPVIQARTKRTRLGVNYRRWRWLDSLEVFRNMNAHVAETGDEKQSMSLNAICQSVLGEGKHDFDANKTWEAWAAGGAERARLLEYNRQDTSLLWKLEKKTQYTRLFGTLCAACRLFVETRSLHAHSQTDGLMLRLGRERGYHWPSKPEHGHHEKFKGAWVMKPPENAGILRNVHVVDFSGLYPSIMISWNMSPETLKTTRDDRPTAKCPLTGSAFYTDKEGVLTSALNVLRGMRKQWTERKASFPPGTPEWQDAERWAMAYKVAANSIYGITGMAFGRYYQPRISEGVTQNGVWLIQSTFTAARERGWNPIYADTDSGFVCGVEQEEFRQFTAWCNAELYPRIVVEQGCTTNVISLAYEKEFERLVFVAAKKYCGRYKHYKGKLATADSKPEIRGLEYKRGDAILVARQMQGECIMLLMRDCCDEPARFRDIVARYREHVLGDALELDEVVMSQTLTQPIADYVAKTPPAHVRVAKQLEERGEDVSVGTKIRYVVIAQKNDSGEGGMVVIPAKDWTGEVDRYALWEARVWPPTKRLLEAAFPQHDWTEFDKVRPKAPRKGKKSSAAQPKLFNPTQTLRLVADEARGFNVRAVQAMREILKLAPDGHAPVQLTFKAAAGEVVMELEREVDVTPELLRRMVCLLGAQGVQW